MVKNSDLMGIFEMVMATNLPKYEKSKGRENGDNDAREDHRIGMDRHLSTPPGEKPLQPTDFR